MLLGGFELVILSILFVFALVVITIQAIAELVIDNFSNSSNVVMIDPNCSKEFQRMVKQRSKTSKPIKRIIHNIDTQETMVLESDSISEDLEDEDIIELSIT